MNKELNFTRQFFKLEDLTPPDHEEQDRESDYVQDTNAETQHIINTYCRGL